MRIAIGLFHFKENGLLSDRSHLYTCTQSGHYDEAALNTVGSYLRDHRRFTTTHEVARISQTGGGMILSDERGETQTSFQLTIMYEPYGDTALILLVVDRRHLCPSFIQAVSGVMQQAMSLI